MVLKIAIVDDDLNFLKSMQEISHDFFKNKKIAVTIDTFQYHRLLMYELDEGTFYDLFLLDIEMNDKGMNGLELAQAIRKIDNKAYIIFVTSHMQYSLEGYEVSALRYIPKSKLKEKLPEALDTIIEIQEKREKSFYLIETITKYVKLYYEDIYYIYKIGKYSIIVSCIGEYKVRKSLALVYKELNSKEFIFVERGFIANIIHIDRMEDEKIFLDSGDILKVSRPQIHLVKESIANYWSDHV